MGQRIKRCGIYAIYCITNNKYYIGHSKSINKRWDNHKYRLRLGTHENQHLQLAWNKYLEETFIFMILERLSDTLTKEELEAEETKWVLKYNAHQKEFGFNKCLPGAIPLTKPGENKTSKERRKIIKKVYSLNMATTELIEYDNCKDISEVLGIKPKTIRACCVYWKDLKKYNKNAIRSYKGYMFIRVSDYIENFDYSTYFKPYNKKNFW